MDQSDLIQKTSNFVQKELKNAEGGHDWWHIYRVWKSAIHIAQNEEGADLFVIELAALLHDIADSKFHNGDETVGPKKAAEFLKSINIDEMIIGHVVSIITNLSFKGGHKASSFSSLELMIVQDADRLDALGAIGIARAFNYGGFKHRELYNPDIPPNLNQTKEAYKQSEAPTLNHFYEKLLRLKDLMNTTTGKALAVERHKFLEVYLEHFCEEWEGNL